MPSVRLLPPCVVDLQCAYAFQACCKSTSEGQGAGVLSPLMAARPEQPLLMPFVCQEASRPRRSWVPILILFVFYVLKRMCPFGIRTYCQYWHVLLAATRQTLRREMARWQVQSDPPLCERVWRERASAQAEERPVVEPGCTLHCTFAFAIPPPLLTRAQKLRCVLTMRNEETGAPCRATRS